METLSQAYEYLFVGAIVVLALLIFCCLIRAIKGPTISDRIVAINMIGTMTIMIIAILAVKICEGYLVDVAIIYAMISFLAVVVLTKVFMGVYKEREEARKKKELEQSQKEMN
ncbi:MAG: cation:proton antiporter [Clostridiales bacterium]|nr:cation:proton antiporter [Clostridiales bacterium]